MADLSQLQDIDFSTLANCTIDTCPLWTSFYNYRIDVVSNSIFVGLFSLALFWIWAVWIFTRRGFLFMMTMTFGLMAEIAGYVARLYSWGNQWDMDAFLAQIICITVGPAFFSAAIYLTLEHVVEVYGEDNSRLPKKWYTRIFIPGDVISLLLQMIGGILAAISLINNGDLTTGDNIVIAGLSTQVFSLFVFIGVCIDFLMRIRRRVKELGPERALNQDASMVQTRESRLFKAFIVAQGLATVLIFWRCCYRVAELNDGWLGPITFDQPLFIGMEPVLITVAVLALSAFHPAICMRAAYKERVRLVTKA